MPDLDSGFTGSVERVPIGAMIMEKGGDQVGRGIGVVSFQLQNGCTQT